jgi:DNA-binding SARP family transcriptional activator
VTEEWWVRMFGGAACTFGDREVQVPSGKPAALMALLALDAGHTVRLSTIIDSLWGDDPPASARALVHTYVSSVRRALATAGPDPIDTVPGGYRLTCPRSAVDVLAFLDAAGSEAGPWETLLSVSAEPLIGGSEQPFLEHWQRRVAEARVVVQDKLWRSQLGEGNAAQVVAELRPALRDEPLNEDRTLLLARALADSGRVGEALAVLDAFRRLLAEELGLDPSPRVAQLRHDLVDTEAGGQVADDAAPRQAHSRRPAVPAPPSRRHRAWVAVAVLAAVLVSGTAAWIGSGDEDDPVVPPDGPSLLVIEPRNALIVDALELPIAPDEIAASGSDIWVRSVTARAVALADLEGDSDVTVVGLSESPSAIAAGEGSAVVALGYSGRTVTVADGRASAPTRPVPGLDGKLLLANGDSGTWIATITGAVHAPASNGTSPVPVELAAAPVSLAVEGTRAWILARRDAQLATIDPTTRGPVVSSLRGEPVDLAVAPRVAWAVTSGDNRLWRATADRGIVVGTWALPGTPVAVTATADSVYVAIESPPSVVSFDTTTMEPGPVIDLSRPPVDLTWATDRLIVAVR